MTTLRKILLTMMVVGALGTMVGAGSFATLNASTTGVDSAFATGTLVLGNQKNTGTICVSTGAGTTTDTNANHTCGDLVNVEVKKPGDVATVDLTLYNYDTLPGTLTVRAHQACVSDTAPGQSYAGGADACASVALTIQQYDTALDRTNGTTTNGSCWFGGGAGGARCSFDATKTLSSFATSHPVAATSNLALGTMPAGGVRYLRVGLQLPAGASNLLQGTRATFGFTWQLDQ